MKKILTVLLFMFGAFTVSIAQTTSPTTPASVSKQDKAVLAAQKKADKQAKALAKKQAKEVNSVAPVTNTPTAHLNKNGTPDKRFKTNTQQMTPTPAQVQTPRRAPVQANAASSVSNTSTAHLNKNGTPDKRFKANSQPIAAPAAQARVTTPAPAQTQATAAPARVQRQAPQVVQSNQVITADKAISTDAQGRTIYQGSRGGKYYINKEGHKEYVK